VFFIIYDKVQLVNEILLAHEKSRVLKANVAIEHKTCNNVHLTTNIYKRRFQNDFFVVYLYFLVGSFFNLIGW
jgi:hypothetical protein